MTRESIFVVSAVRTAIGSFGGALKDVPLAALATTVVKAAVSRSGAAAEQVGHLVMGNVVPSEPRDAYLSRVAALDAGLPKEVPAFKKEGGSVTAGNASGINDGAGAVMLAAIFERV